MSDMGPKTGEYTATAAGVLLNHYREQPEHIVLRLLYSRRAEEAITYRRLVEGAAGYAAGLARAGIQPGEVCLLILDHGPDLVLSYFAAVLRGAIPAIMPFLTEKLAPDQYRASLAALFAITRPAAVITYPEFVPEVRSAVIAASSGGEPGSVRRILVAGEETVSGETSGVEIQRLVDGGALFLDGPQPPEAETPLQGLAAHPEDILLLQHSSGTTGLQKGVALSHRAVFNQLESYARALRLNQEDVIVSWLPLYHDMGLIAGFLLPILSGVPLVLLSPFDWVRAPYRLLQAVSQYRGTLTWLPNFAYNFCAQKIRDRDLEGVDLSSWRAVINCSEPMYWSSHRMFAERFRPYGLRPEALATCYAMAENVFAVTQGGIDSPVTVDWVDRQALLNRQSAEPAQDPESALPMLSAGRPISGVEVRVLDPQGRDLPERQVGEIALRSHCMLSGYYRRPDLTEKAFLDGWYVTGDLGYMADGEVYITGRKKDLIIVGGKNVYPQDLERLASEVPGVHPGRVAAFGVANQQTGTEEVVVVAESDEPPKEFARIADEVRQRVTRGSDVALRYVLIVERNWLLKTSSGKVARAANREKYLSQVANEG